MIRSWACLVSLVCLTLGQVAGAAAPTTPKVLDDRLQLELISQQPDLVTPVGLAIDGQGRVFVVESHTHFPPANYSGPKSDRIRLFVDSNGDGKPDRVSTFHEGLKFTMNVAVDRDGSLLVATRSEILRLRDRDQDGVADETTSLAKLLTAGNYPHNGLSGFTFDFRGRIYFGFGENLGADYRLVGSDGKSLAGGGEGGNIYRCEPDGRDLTLVATGFWNPFHLSIDEVGRLWAVDNDPDSRPPCRLIHVVPGGDYGYRFRNGRKGTHPFTAWNGELPGTLPMASGTGEAPSGVLAYESDQLPAAKYQGNLLVTSWGDHRLDLFEPRARGASFLAAGRPLVVGDDQFRPVGVAVAPDGSIYFTDWVDKSYQLHGQGRLWRLSLKDAPPRTKLASDREALQSADRAIRTAAARRLAASGAAGRDQLLELLVKSEQPAVAVGVLAEHWTQLTESQRQQFVRAWTAAASPLIQAFALEATEGALVDLKDWSAASRPAIVRAAAYRVMKLPEQQAILRQGLLDADPFIQQAARHGLMQAGFDPLSIDWSKLQHPGERANGVLLLRAGGGERARERIPQLLKDSDPAVRFLAVQWIGEERLTTLRPQLEETLRERATTRQLFEGCLAALEMIDGTKRSPTDEWQGEQYVVRMLLDPQAAPTVRRQALRTLRPSHPELTLARLERLLADEDAAVRLEAIRTLRDHPAAERHKLLLSIAANSQRSARERAEAMMGLSAEDNEPGGAREQLLSWSTGDESPVVAIEALRGLRGAQLTAPQRDQLRQAAERRTPAWRELLAKVLAPAAAEAAPTAPEASEALVDRWLQLLSGPGDAEAGERIFFHPRATGCYRCHEQDGRGAGLGPELTRVTSTMTTRRLVESLVDPSREIAPQFVPWVIETEAGQVRIGMLVGEEVDGTQRYVESTGAEFRLKPAQIAERRPHGRSIMPDGLPGLLTPQEFRDLIAYLTQSKEPQSKDLQSKATNSPGTPSR
ncbi:MAG: PVC-type heme-binding CxxCH protein [Planctomycetota bacterium]